MEILSKRNCFFSIDNHVEWKSDQIWLESDENDKIFTAIVLNRYKIAMICSTVQYMRMLILISVDFKINF